MKRLLAAVILVAAVVLLAVITINHQFTKDGSTKKAWVEVDTLLWYRDIDSSAYRGCIVYHFHKVVSYDSNVFPNNPETWRTKTNELAQEFSLKLGNQHSVVVYLYANNKRTLKGWVWADCGFVLKEGTEADLLFVTEHTDEVRASEYENILEINRWRISSGEPGYDFIIPREE